MKIKKSKLIFSGVLLSILLFIGGYTLLIMDEEEEPVITNNRIPLPELEDNQKEYTSKLDALDDMKEVRQNNAPSMYDERLLDSTGVYDPDLLDREKKRVVDSIYQQGRIRYSKHTLKTSNTANRPINSNKRTEKTIGAADIKKELQVEAKEMGLEHQLFFASRPIENEDFVKRHSDTFIYVIVDGTQTVKTDYRLRMRLLQDAFIYGKHIAKNTPIYGFVSFKPNRTIIDIESINHQPVNLTAYDYQDGSAGIYIQNNFRAEVTSEIVGDMVDDINIAGVPQVSGFQKIFQRNHRNVKVTITDNYKLILKISGLRNKLNL
ncbi:conjugative transposon protein TraM [Zobellia galactanivorans]|uniref:conjugative transposon protein TraM n=1 Tax=Zobellia galactanivorans (strain DSM 12802 / CCUG 47099 / CIP 106680 / NCIMB 13871 / Dsij) TaxID=63186 RepID=UPI001C0747FD|nr:conjugative transposon protein TraM [Zobellia galactanivorans]MBU3027034.1 conjugative transposon protein TraM [Zobellia galactanivorans]